MVGTKYYLGNFLIEVESRAFVTILMEEGGDVGLLLDGEPFLASVMTVVGGSSVQEPHHLLTHFGDVATSHLVEEV